MENIIDTLFGNALFSNIYFTDENPAKVEKIDISKINNEIIEVKNFQVFDLFKYDIPRSGLISLNIRENIKSNLLIKLNFSQKENLKYFNLGFIKNLFNKRNVNTLLKKFEGKDWIITYDNIISELSKFSSITLNILFSMILICEHIFSLNILSLFLLPSLSA